MDFLDHISEDELIKCLKMRQVGIQTICRSFWGLRIFWVFVCLFVCLWVFLLSRVLFSHACIMYLSWSVLSFRLEGKHFFRLLCTTLFCTCSSLLSCTLPELSSWLPKFSIMFPQYKAEYGCPLHKCSNNSWDNYRAILFVPFLFRLPLQCYLTNVWKLLFRIFFLVQ